MEFLKLLLYIGLIHTTAMTAYATEESENRSNRASKDPEDPLPYDLSLIDSNVRLIPYIEENNVTYHGEYNVTIKMNKAMHLICVFLIDTKMIDETATKLMSADDNGAIYRPANYTYYKSIILTLTFDEELSPGFYILYMKFGGIVALNDLNKVGTSYITKEGGRLLKIRGMAFPLVMVKLPDLPCWGNRVLHTIEISIKHHQTFKALSHMPIIKQNIDDDGMMWTYFNTIHSMSICGLTVILTDYAYVHNANETINLWCRPHLTSYMKHAQSVAEKVMEYMVQYANITKTISKIDQVMIPDLPVSGLAQQGIIFYNELAVAYDNWTEPTYNQIDVTKIITHELTHQWFGVVVSPSNDAYRWLNEGLASFFETYISDKIFPNWRMIDSMVVDILQGCLGEDTGLTMSPINVEKRYTPEGSPKYRFDEGNFEYLPEYDKAQVVLRMLQHAVTNEVFQNGILTYLNTFQSKSVTPDYLWHAMDRVLPLSPHRDFVVKEVMDTWMNQRNYPLVIVTRDYETGETFISQDDFRLSDIESGPAKKWWVPVTFATQTNPNFSNTKPYSWLSPSRAHLYMIQVDPNDWIIVNVQQVGYYRVKYDARNWQKIIQTLNEGHGHKKIHVLNRAQIIDDAFVLMTRKLSLDLITFFELMNYLALETDYIAWCPVFRNLAKMSKYFPLPESEFFTSHMADVFDIPLRKVRYEEEINEDDFTKLKRLKMTKWACLVGNLECKRMANAKLNYYLADIKNHKLSYWWQRWTYCSGLMAANRTTWDRIMDLYMQKRDKIFLEYLTCSEDSDIIINYLNIISSNNSTIPQQDRIFALKRIIIKHARNNQVLDYILGNFETVKPISVIAAALLEDIISNVYTEAQLEKIKSNVKNGMHQEILTTIQPVIESRLVALRNLIESFSAWFMKEEKQA